MRADARAGARRGRVADDSNALVALVFLRHLLLVSRAIGYKGRVTLQPPSLPYRPRVEAAAVACAGRDRHRRRPHLHQRSRVLVDARERAARRPARSWPSSSRPARRSPSPAPPWRSTRPGTRSSPRSVPEKGRARHTLREGDYKLRVFHPRYGVEVRQVQVQSRHIIRGPHRTVAPGHGGLRGRAQARRRQRQRRQAPLPQVRPRLVTWGPRHGPQAPNVRGAPAKP